MHAPIHYHVNTGVTVYHTHADERKAGEGGGYWGAVVGVKYHLKIKGVSTLRTSD